MANIIRGTLGCVTPGTNEQVAEQKTLDGMDVGCQSTWHRVPVPICDLNSHDIIR